MSVVISLSKGVLWHPLSSSCSIQGIIHGFCGFLFHLHGCGCGCGGGSGWVGAGFCCLRCLEIIKNNNIFNSIKKPEHPLLQRVFSDVSLSSLKCDISAKSLVTAVYIV